MISLGLVAGCAAPTVLSRYPDFPRAKPSLGTLVILGDVTTLHYKSGDIQKLDLVESEQLGATLLDEIARGLREKGYIVGKTVHATAGWTLRQGTLVYLIRTVEDRNRDPLPLGEAPVYLSPEFAGDPALRQAWETLRSSSATTDAVGTALSRLGQAFGADTLVTVMWTGRHVPLSTQTGRAMLAALTFGATDAPETSAFRWIRFTDPRSGRVLWDDLAPALYLTEQTVRGLAAEMVRSLP